MATKTNNNNNVVVLTSNSNKLLHTAVSTLTY